MHIVFVCDCSRRIVFSSSFVRRSSSQSIQILSNIQPVALAFSYSSTNLPQIFLSFFLGIVDWLLVATRTRFNLCLLDFIELSFFVRWIPRQIIMPCTILNAGFITASGLWIAVESRYPKKSLQCNHMQLCNPCNLPSSSWSTGFTSHISDILGGYLVHRKKPGHMRSFPKYPLAALSDAICSSVFDSLRELFSSTWRVQSPKVTRYDENPKNSNSLVTAKTVFATVLPPGWQTIAGILLEKLLISGNHLEFPANTTNFSENLAADAGQLCLSKK